MRLTNYFLILDLRKKPKKLNFSKHFCKCLSFARKLINNSATLIYVKHREFKVFCCCFWYLNQSIPMKQIPWRFWESSIIQPWGLALEIWLSILSKCLSRSIRYLMQHWKRILLYCLPHKLLKVWNIIFGIWCKVIVIHRLHMKHVKTIQISIINVKSMSRDLDHPK